MALTKFKITELPISTNILLKIAEIPVVLNQEYSRSQQSLLTADALNRGVPLGFFKFQIGNDNGIWSIEYVASISAAVNVFTPEVITTNILTETNLITLINPFLIFKSSTDRVRIHSIIGEQGFYVNGTLAIIGKTYFLYEFINVIFIGYDVNATVINLIPANATTSGAITPLIINIKNNLSGIIFGQAEFNIFSGEENPEDLNQII